MTDFQMIDIDELGERKVNGKYFAAVQAAVDNPGKAILVPNCKASQNIIQSKYARKAGVNAIMRNGKVYVYLPIDKRGE